MSSSIPVGPFSVFTAADGSSIPLYLISFDKEGHCLTPKTLQDLQEHAASGQFSDIHIYSHGWNNVFSEAVAHYTEFFTEYFNIRRKANLSDAQYLPLIVGVIWPSTALVSEAEDAPKFAADVPLAIRAGAMANDLYATSELASELSPDKVPRFLELADKARLLSRDEALELARMLLPLFQHEGADREGIAQSVTPETLINAWAQSAGVDDDHAAEGGPAAIPDEECAGTNTARSAGLLDLFDPRQIIRIATVYLMKDRAGVVGARGVGPMLATLLRDSKNASVHLAGHSFGAKVVLSALTLVEHPRKVTSVLLLQPAVNLMCFAKSIVDNGGQPGAFRPALNKTERPIFSTFSALDAPLSDFFQIALRRDVDLGEMGRFAGEPSKFAALGGYGPRGMVEGESKTIPILGWPEQYDLSDPDIRLYALDGSQQRITGHADVRNEFTEWAMVNQVSPTELRR